MSSATSESPGRLIHLSTRDSRNFAEKFLFPCGLIAEQPHPLKHMPGVEGTSQRSPGDPVNKIPAGVRCILDLLRARPQNLKTE